ncbi:MAG: Arc domain-containing protein [Rhizobiaceae bacterium]|nr:Arc domain-containing protein [Rhizobiaceae bacterium]
MKIRLPADAKAFVEAEAKINASSQNSEIVRAIRAAMKAKGLSSTPSQEAGAR